MVLGNTYHLALRPGEEVVRELGGLHRFMGWDGPILTDSGGFQLFSLAQNTKVTEQAAVFRSHIDGQLLELSPERAVAIQEALGSDVAMVLDHVVALPADRRRHSRCLRAHRSAGPSAARRPPRAPIRRCSPSCKAASIPSCASWCAEQLAELDFPGYAVGGLSVGESPDEMYRILDVAVPAHARRSSRAT